MTVLTNRAGVKKTKIVAPDRGAQPTWSWPTHLVPETWSQQNRISKFSSDPVETGRTRTSLRMFVMSFLGPVTTLDNHLVRRHDLEIETHLFNGAYPGRIERFNRVGFEVRPDMQPKRTKHRRYS